MSKTQHVVDMLFSSLARAEEQLFSDAKILPSFPRSIQLNGYSCGAKSTYMVLRYFGCRCTAGSVEQWLRTTTDGTSSSDIKRVLREYGLKAVVNARMDVQDLKAAIDAGSPVLVSLYNDEHYSVVYGYSPTHVFVMNPSLGKMGSVSCAVGLCKWNQIYDCWGIVVRNQ